MLELRERISIQFTDETTAQEDFSGAVLRGLKQPRKTLSPKFFYDRKGSELFEKICRLPEYYLTRTERTIFRRYVMQMAKALEGSETLIEYGSGASEKVQLLLDECEQLRSCVSIDISRDFLLEATTRLARRYPSLQTYAICADYTQAFSLPEEIENTSKVIFFPGSTIGNLTTEDAKALLEKMAAVAGPGGKLLIGVDLVKDVDVLEAAYDDEQKVTAEFNLNLLERINREAGGTFDKTKFAHRAFFNESESRIEMHLVSREKQTVQIDGEVVDFDKGESIHTENSHKYSVRAFHDLAEAAGWEPSRLWTDDNEWFGVFLLQVR